MSEVRESGARAATVNVEIRAAELLQRRRFWNWSEADQAELDGWLDEALAHRVAFLRLEAGLERTERLAALRPPEPEREARARRRFVAMLAKTVAGVGAVAVLGVSAVLYLPWTRTQTYTTPVGGHEIVALADGSHIELNTDTIVHADVGADHRTASLDRGEAFFDISHDVGHPFTVAVAGHHITVLGTKFRIRSESGHVEVALLEGRVWFDAGSSPGQAALLVPGDVLVARANTISVTKEPAQDLAGSLGWRRGMLVFHDTTLTDAAAEFNRYNSRKLVIAGADTARLTIGASFPVNGVEAFTRVAREIFGLHVETRGDQIVISR
jgi:transmembrane sensor